MKRFDNEWIFERFDGHSTFFTKRMFGGLAAYVHERLMMLLVEPTKSGTWQWHGVLVCTDYAHHASIVKDVPALVPHEALSKWLYIDSTHDEFESAMEQVARAVARDDPRFGIRPRVRTARRARRAETVKSSSGTTIKSPR